ncbi:hypothetical protein COU89_03255 [Candidatus Roizmanbacteria bacterium CG10_big_fil_rev_8_21_14_0_10_45_7]|uniref:Uncharacterized protein n=1 Tax=Candidatus Roizmanbacteria bacterium CG10_big_fil_rev_8_21_14_0_10_45_7 TaxID=1974854 RepID=A0A2M8KU38_9BACT|nr:MAG: hypothetical protein COU89_03255 [Candidatus Roizmanbacteria bacterium CG10_big_fil_rev_8_21_14_0_10_45_7]
MIGPSTPLPEKKGVQSHFSSELPKQHAHMVMQGILAPVLPYLGNAFASPAESPEQLMASLQQVHHALRDTPDIFPPEITRLENFERLAGVAFEHLDPTDEEYTIKAERQKLVLGRMVSDAGFIPRSAFNALAQERMNSIMKAAEARRTSNQLTQADIDLANKQMAMLSQLGNGALLMPEDLDRFVPLMTENGIALKMDSATRSQMNELSKQYKAYVSALSQQQPNEASRKTITEWLGTSQQTAQQLEELLNNISQFTTSTEKRKEVTDKIVNGGKGVAFMLLFLALAIGATGLSSMDHA